ncbi:MAG: sulfite exporter TauE/SafE family protein [Euryarchaeota archaeon TMED117]|nr:MAG: sulfite exporter TauE/SafE family protein [Euryarchaeota archaeon TMED117]
MEDGIEEKSSLFQRVLNSPFLHPTALVLGAVIALSESIYLLLLGEPIQNAIWPQAIRTLAWTFFLRQHIATITVLSAIILALSIWVAIRKQKGVQLHPLAIVCLLMLIGAVFASWIIFLLMDIRYIRGAFLLLPTIYGVLLLSAAIAVKGPPHLPKREQSKTEKTYTALHLCTIFFAAWLVMPGIPALIGIAPSPPDTPSMGYGAQPGPFDSASIQYPYPIPELVSEIQGPTEDDIEFSVYLHLPQLPSDPGIEGVPLAILFHAFNNPSIESYSDWIDHLVGKGMVVAYIQYPTDVRPKEAETFTLVEENGMSNWPHHVPRMHALQSAMDLLQERIDDTTRDDFVNQTLGELKILPEHLWIGGHSLGGAYSLQALQMALDKQWGNQTLVVDTEMAAARPVQENWLPNYTNLPENTLVHLVVSEDDMTVGQCDSVHHIELFNMVDDNHTLLIYIPSDRYGFPRLVATHYIPANEAHDTLADWAMYRRIDAQADWVVAHSRGDLNTADFAYANLIDTPMLSNMGKWSDGTPVLPLQVYSNPSESGLFASCF